jgi:hypothetical protein
VEQLPDRFDRFAFTHALIREVLYAQRSRTRRARLLERVGELLEHAQAGASPAECAHHFFLVRHVAGAEKAVRYCAKAAAAAVDALAYEDGAGHRAEAVNAEIRRWQRDAGAVREVIGAVPDAPLREELLAEADIHRDAGFLHARGPVEIVPILPRAAHSNVLHVVCPKPVARAARGRAARRAPRAARARRLRRVTGAPSGPASLPGVAPRSGRT